MTERVDLTKLEAVAERIWCLQGLDDSVLTGDAELIRAAIAELTELRQERAGGWVACSERMPEPQQWVLAFEDGSICVAHWGGGPMWWPDRIASDAFPVAEITHWMPLPNPPEATDG